MWRSAESAFLVRGSNRGGQGAKLADEQAQAGEKEDVLKAISQLARKVRADLGESADSIRQFDVSLDAATSSLEAFHAYASGWNVLTGRGQYPKADEKITTEWFLSAQEPSEAYAKAAVPYFQQAIHWDSSFGLAYSALARCYWSIGGPASENATKAYQLRDRVGQRQRFGIERTYYELQESGDHPHAQEARDLYAAWERTYPHDAELHFARFWSYFQIGQYEKALQEFHEAKRLKPDAEGYGETILILLYLNRWSEARKELEEMRAKSFYPVFVHVALYRLAFLQDDAAEMSREAAWAADKPFATDFLSLEAATAAYYGKFAKARELSQHAMDSAKQNNLIGRAWDVQATQVVREVLAGNIEEGHRAGVAFDDYPPYSQEKLALALALAGETARPSNFAERIGKQLSRDNIWLTAVRAQVWLNQRNAAKAVELLEFVEPYKLVGLYDPYAADAVYIRAYANLAAPHFDAARADFQEILDHRGAVGNSLVGALARVGLARACVLQGDTAGAKSAYQDFLTLWKDADPDIPVLKQAKAEYAKLQ